MLYTIYLILSTLTADSLGASKRAANCCLTLWTCKVSSMRGFLATDSCTSSTALRLTCSTYYTYKSNCDKQENAKKSINLT